MAKSPEQRFQHASDLAFALEALSDSGIGAAPAVKGTATFKRKWVWVAATVAATAGLIYWWARPPAVPIVQVITQLTDDGVAKYPFDKLATDGPRIYFTEGETASYNIAVVAGNGGPTAILPVRFSSPQISALSPDGGSLLAMEVTSDLPPYRLWTVPLPAGESHRIGSIEANDASYLPDGRILFVLGTDLSVAERDGSSPSKLVSTDKSLVTVKDPSMSPDGSRIVFTAEQKSHHVATSIMQINTDGSGLRTLTTNLPGSPVCCPNWTRDGKYLLYARRHEGIWNVWALPMPGGILHRSSPVQLTNGPLSYSEVTPSTDGKRLFSVGTKLRGELVRYDTPSKQFVPILSGISAFDITYSADGNWVAYISYPNETLWRSRADGTDRLQLTFGPMRVIFPFISPDGKRVAFRTAEGDAYVINMDGSEQQHVGTRFSLAPNWSPDGNWLVMTHSENSFDTDLRLLNLKTADVSVVPSSAGLGGAQWIGPDEFVAVSGHNEKLVTFNSRTQTWSDLVSGAIVNWAHSPDYKYLYYTTGGADPKAMRIRLADHKVELITSLKNIRRAVSPGGSTQISVAPDGSPVFTRDIGTQEMYSLTVKWP